MSMQNTRLICLGIISGSRGLKGEVRIKSFTEDPVSISSYGLLCDKSGKRQFDVKFISSVKGQIIARIKGIHNRMAADALKGTKLFVKRSALPKPNDDEYYYQDLIGLRVNFVNGEQVGIVRNIEDFGAGTLLEIETKTNKSNLEDLILVPFTRKAVPIVDIENGIIVIYYLPGLFEKFDASEETIEEDNENKLEQGY